jgi:hypothetical protein
VKRIIQAFLIAILCGLSCNSYCNNACSCLPNFYSGISLGLTGLYWQASIPELDYAFQGALNANGNYAIVNPNYFWGYRVYLSYAFPCSNNETLLSYSNYQHFKINHTATDEPFTLFPTFFTGNANNIGVTDFVIAFPLGITATVTLPVPILEASMDTRFDYQAWDMELAEHINVTPRFKVRWFGGLRYVNLKQELHAFYSGTNTTIVPTTELGLIAPVMVTGNVTIKERSNYHGIGPRFGTYNSFELFNKIALIAEISTALLVGESNTYFDNTFQNVVTSELVNEVTGQPIFGTNTLETSVSTVSFRYPQETRIIPNLEGKLGINYTYLFCNQNHTRITFEAGWMASEYFKIFDRTSGIDTINPEFTTRHTFNTSFNGPYIDVRMRL